MFGRHLRFNPFLHKTINHSSCSFELTAGIYMTYWTRIWINGTMILSISFPLLQKLLSSLLSLSTHVICKTLAFGLAPWTVYTLLNRCTCYEFISKFNSVTIIHISQLESVFEVVDSTKNLNTSLAFGSQLSSHLF